MRTDDYSLLRRVISVRHVANGGDEVEGASSPLLRLDPGFEIIEPTCNMENE